ncbi:DUF6491 family protein [Fulvimonas yonginensis]|uniref:DUF6491 family protein n=1 Tax=Fulvimonas yonginensis TaxID=1495200 RepID=A0ABU8JAI1_9GAMM
MKRLPSLLTFAFAATAAAFAGHASEHKPLPYAQCIQTDKINEWYVVDQRTALVRTGPYRYRVRLQADCPRLGIGVPGLWLHANESNKANASGRICGEVGETVSARDQPPCGIASVTLIDKGEFDRMRLHAKRQGTGAEPPSSP